MINHIPPIGAKRMMVYMAMENMKPCLLYTSDAADE